MKKVMIFGAFDGVHPGHLDFFKQAKKFGDYLIVSVGTDNNVLKIKGKAPLFTEDERLELISSLKIVDLAILGARDDFYAHIKEQMPDVVCLGYDQWAKEEEVRDKLISNGLTDCEVIRLKPFEEERAKSTILKNDSVDFN